MEGLNHLKMLRAIISARFRNGPGSEKVPANEYEIFNASDTSQTLCEPSFCGLIPGMKLTMAFIIGRYDTGPLEQCPRPGCRSRIFDKENAGGQKCCACQVWFDLSKVALPRPFRLGSTENIFQRLRTERKWYKNVKICASGIPKLPPTSDHRGMWIKVDEGQNFTGKMITKVEDEVRQKNLRESMSSFDLNDFDRKRGEAAAAQAIKEICEHTFLSIEELKDLCSNDFKSEHLGVDSLLMFGIMNVLQNLGINSPKLNYESGYWQPLLFEEFIKDFVNEYWYCSENFRSERACSRTINHTKESFDTLSIFEGIESLFQE